MAEPLGMQEPELDPRVSVILQAASDFDLTESEAWSDLDELSTHTYVDDVEVDPAGIKIEGNEFKGIMSVYVLLQYGKDNDEGFQTSDAFRGHFSGHFDGDLAIIDSVAVDTSPFFEGEER